ncbi:hypothetical protein HII31_11939 [Pseudocercospora fuligena]|uniref:Uncharacterized protein n=1 Tax=Pseudocercospora fuligena TaxID=685502 RepID=A0A8H6RA49_9PEZI|nr:hypothetical protein HII31_11939 [Pseudocercospora fuligena]
MSNTMQSDHLDTYWRLKTPPISPERYRHYLRRRVERHLPGPELSKQQYAEHIARYQHHRLLYKKCSLEELKRFAHDRGLAVTNSSRREIAKFTSMLTDADSNSCFHHFMDLPPELRLVIYEHHFAAFAGRLTYPSQPPLARVSRGLRLEVLPVFYQQCRFTITYQSRNAGPPFRATLETHAFLSTISYAHFGKICNIKIDIYAADLRVVGSLIMKKTNSRWTIIMAGFSAEKTEAVESALKETTNVMCDDRGKARELTRDDIYRVRNAVERGWMDV